jgi:S1-C subfamily serine protease
MTCRFNAFLFLTSLLFQGCAWQNTPTNDNSATVIGEPATEVIRPVTASDSLPALFKKVSPSVVVIQTVEKKFTGKFKDGKAEEEPAYGLGSGVLISSDGKVLTAAHVVHTADAVEVKFQNGEKVKARVIGSVPSADVSLLQLEKVPEGVSPAILGDSDRMQVGERVMVIGAPYGISNALTTGYISGRIDPDDQLFGQQQMELFQSDAAVNSGNSGGPMFNMQGEVIGIVSSILSRSGGFEGISFAVTAKTAKKLLLDQPSYWLGIDAVVLSETMARVLNVPGGSGVLIQRVADGSIGDQLKLAAGFIPLKIAKQDIIVGGDIVIQILGKPVPKSLEAQKSYFEHLHKQFSAMKPGDRFSVKVLRSGELIELATTIE